MSETKKEIRQPGFWFALLLMVAICIVVIVPYVKWSVPMAATFFICWLFVIPACMFLGHSYADLEAAAFGYAGKIITSVFILLSVGGMIGAWIAAGTVSSIVYIGLKLITPKFFLFITFAVGTLYAMACGTSWGTLGTIGVAMSAVGLGMNIPPAMTAGAVVSAAFFGDGFSPMSDSPNLAAATTGVKLMDHVRHLSKIQVPALIINAVLYIILGFKFAGGQVEDALTMQIMTTLGDHYKIGIIAFLPALVVIVLLLLKKSAVWSILISSFTGIVISILYQGQTLSGALGCFWSGVQSDTGVELVDSLLSRGGVTSLFSSAALYLITFGLIGILTYAGILDAVVAPLVKRVKTGFQLLITTMLTGVLGDAVGCSGSFAYIFAGNLMAPLYKKMNVSNLDLARNLACSVTPLGVLIPWNMNAVIALELLGVSCLQYAPYCFQAFTMPILLIVSYLILGKKGRAKNEQN